MADVIVTYKTPKDPAAFDKYYAETHIPLAKKMPGLRKYQISRGPVVSPAGPSGIHLIATLTFDNMDAVKAAFGSPEGKAAASDVANFATGGADIVFYETREV
ncbi:EthD family reductase [Bradyrhizobium sp. ARR65]|uniref:EthD family reductase n=1 Tax=Bradyrhizobium sp. ARR65 TaxID=1040989 RepID=UPI000466EAAB|nr:EthD family reductase [Bradyrhizobium sp. ARR65]